MILRERDCKRSREFPRRWEKFPTCERYFDSWVIVARGTVSNESDSTASASCSRKVRSLLESSDFFLLETIWDEFTDSLRHIPLYGLEGRVTMLWKSGYVQALGWRLLANTTRKSTSRNSHASTHQAQHKTTRSKRTTHTRKTRASGHETSHGPRKHGTVDETYVFECTRLGCGYKIVREEKAEIGQSRFDLKCPKCHNMEFKCLGKGDLPESFELPVSATNIDFDSIRPVDLGSN